MCVYVITFVYDECTCMHVFFVCNVSSVGMGCVYMPTYVRDLYDTSAVCDYLSMYECITDSGTSSAVYIPGFYEIHARRAVHAHTTQCMCACVRVRVYACPCM